MKRTQTIFLALVVIIAITFAVSSCGQKENQTPVVTIEEPADNDTISVTDSLHIEGTLTDDESLHEASILVIQSTGDTALLEYPYVHDLKTYDYHYHFHPSSVGTYTVKVTAEDHEEKSSTVIRSITVN